jgi:hypothetical protein
MLKIEKARRYLIKMRRIYSGVPYAEDECEGYIDDIESFFVFCHHIRDFFLHPNGYKVDKRTVNEFVKRNDHLCICADIANKIKHRELKTRWTDKAYTEPRIVRVAWESDGTNYVFHTMRGKCEVVHQNQWIDALDLAERCMKSWDEFLTEAKRNIGC